MMIHQKEVVTMVEKKKMILMLKSKHNQNKKQKIKS